MKKPPRQTLLVNVNGVSRLMGNAGGMERREYKERKNRKIIDGDF